MPFTHFDYLTICRVFTVVTYTFFKIFCFPWPYVCAVFLSKLLNTAWEKVSVTKTGCSTNIIPHPCSWNWGGSERFQPGLEQWNHHRAPLHLCSNNCSFKSNSEFWLNCQTQCWKPLVQLIVVLMFKRTDCDKTLRHCTETKEWVQIYGFLTITGKKNVIFHTQPSPHYCQSAKSFLTWQE